MPLLIALIFFFFMCFLMVIFLGKSKAPSAVETTEAFCDALIRNDKNTLKAISNLESIPAEVVEALGFFKDEYPKPGKKYEFSNVRERDSVDASYYQIDLATKDGKIVKFELVKSINRWVVRNVGMAND